MNRKTDISQKTDREIIEEISSDLSKTKITLRIVIVLLAITLIMVFLLFCHYFIAESVIGKAIGIISRLFG